MANSLISRKYAKALLEAACEQKNLEAMLEEMAQLKQVLIDCQAQKFFASRTVTDKAKEQLLELFLSQSSPMMTNFLKVIESNHRLDKLLEMAINFEDLANTALGKAEIKVTTAVPVSESQKQKLQALIQSKFALNSIDMKNYVDEKILGGFIIQNKEKVLDVSIKTQLAKIATQLL